MKKSCIQACLLGKKLSLHAQGHFLLFLINELILPGMTCQNPCPVSRQGRCIVKMRKCLLCSLFVNGQGFWHFIPGINAILPSWTLILSESWGKSKTDFKGEVDGFKIEEREGPGEELIKCYLKVTYLARKFTCTCPGLLDGTFLEPVEMVATWKYWPGPTWTRKYCLLTKSIMKILCQSFRISKGLYS